MKRREETAAPPAPALVPEPEEHAEDKRPSAVIAAARKRAELTQKQLGERMGVGKTTITRIEDGSHEPTLSTLQRAAKALGVRFEVSIDAESVVAKAVKPRAHPSA